MFHGAIRDKAGNLWFATMGAGVYRYDAVTSTFTNFKERDGLCNNNVYSVFEDKAGKLWFSTEYGICNFDGKSFINFTMKEGLCENRPILFCEDRSGNLWFGTNGSGICRYDQNSGEFKHYTKEEGLGSIFIQCIFEDKAGNIWVGERAGGVCRFDSVTDRFVSVNGDGCLSNQIMGIIEDQKGNIWFANLYSGLCRYDGKSFIHITQADGLCHDYVTCIYEDKKGNIWCGSDAGNWGTGGGGLCRYDPVSKVYTRFTTKDGIRNMNVWTIVEDNEGNIWVGCKGGLYRYHSPSGRFVEYTHKVNGE